MGNLRVDTITASDGTSPVTLTKQSAAKIWMLFNSSGTVADSLNISTVTDHGTGDFTENYSNSMSSVNYTKLGTSGQADSGGTGMGLVGQNEDNETKTTSAMRLYVLTTGNGATDRPRISTTTHGDLA